MFIETSAKAGHNVKMLFRRIAQALPGINGNTNEKEQSKAIVILLLDKNLITTYITVVQKIHLNSSNTESSGCAC